MKRIIITFLLTFAVVFSYAQKHIPVGMRIEVAGTGQDDNEYSIFKYLDEDNNLGYYLSLGHVSRILEITGSDILDVTLDRIDETCLCMGVTADDAFTFLESLRDLLENDPGTTTTFQCRMVTNAEKLGDYSMAHCMVVKRFLQSKRLKFQFKSRQKTAETEITRSAIKSLRNSFKVYKQLNPND